MLGAQHVYPMDDARCGSTWSIWAAGAATALLVAGVATTDLLTANVNLSILYILPLLLSGRMRLRVWVWQLAAVLVALTYIGYFFGPRAAHQTQGWQEMVWDYRFTNRTLSAVAILVVAMMVQFWIGMREKNAMSHIATARHDPEQETVDQILQSFEVLGTALICGLMMFCIGLADVLSPGEFNLPILYVVPLMLCGAVRSRTLLWSILPFLLGLTLLGFVIGHSPTQPANMFQSLITNRYLAAAVQVAMALLIHTWIRERDSGSSPASR